MAGAINAGGFLAVQQDTSHMTGIVSSMAENSAVGAYDLVWVGAGALLSFMAGAACSAVMVNMARRAEVRGLFVTVMLLCFVMGLQNAVITKLSGSAVRTTHITGVVPDIGIDLGKLLHWNVGSPSGLGKVLADSKRLGVLIRMARAGQWCIKLRLRGRHK